MLHFSGVNLASAFRIVEPTEEENESPSVPNTGENYGQHEVEVVKTSCATAMVVLGIVAFGLVLCRRRIIR